MEKIQNKTKIMVSILVLLLLVLTACLFAACGDDPVSPGIEIKAAFKTEYVIGDELDVSGGILAYTNEDGQTKDVEITEEMISGFTTETAGTRSMVLTYEGLTLTIEYEVKSPALPTVGVVYRAITTLSGEDSRFYVLFVNENTIKIVLGTDECLDPNNSAWDRGDALIPSAVRNVENGKYVYTFDVGADSDAKLTVESETGLSMIWPNSSSTTFFEFEVQSLELPTIGAVYRATTTLPNEDSRFYVLFVDENTFKIVLGTDECLDPNNSAWDRVDALVSSATRTVENGKCVYSFDNGGSTEAKLTVESETSLTFVADDADFTFTISSQA